MSRTPPGRRLAIIVLLAANLAVGALVALELRQPDIFVRTLALPSPEAPGQDTPVVSPGNPASILPGEADLAVVVARPLFSPTRRPPPPDETASAATGPADLSGLRLVGVVGSENAYVAIIEYSRPRGKTVHLRAGDKLEGWLVEKIETEQVILHQGDARHGMALSVRKRKRQPTRRTKPGTPQRTVPATPGQPAPDNDD